jgi:hypothetical protein
MQEPLEKKVLAGHVRQVLLSAAHVKQEIWQEEQALFVFPAAVKVFVGHERQDEPLR